MPLPSNANLFKTFKGKYDLTLPDNTTKPIMLSCTNDVIFLDRLTSDANKIIGTVPVELTPTRNTITIIMLAQGNTVEYWDIKTNGQVKAQSANKMYYSEGQSYNISSNFYA